MKDPLAKPADKCALLADAAKWSTNIGHPGHANVAVEEVFEQTPGPNAGMPLR